jgi:hypothetical protein
MVSRSTFAASPLKVATHACTEAVKRTVNETNVGLETIAHQSLRPRTSLIRQDLVHRRGFALKTRLDTNTIRAIDVGRKE